MPQRNGASRGPRNPAEFGVSGPAQPDHATGRHMRPNIPGTALRGVVRAARASATWCGHPARPCSTAFRHAAALPGRRRGLSVAGRGARSSGRRDDDRGPVPGCSTFVRCCGPPGSYKLVRPRRPPATLPSTWVLTRARTCHAAVRSRGSGASGGGGVAPRAVRPRRSPSRSPRCGRDPDHERLGGGARGGGRGWSGSVRGRCVAGGVVADGAARGGGPRRGRVGRAGGQ